MLQRISHLVPQYALDINNPCLLITNWFVGLTQKNFHHVTLSFKNARLQRFAKNATLKLIDLVNIFNLELILGSFFAILKRRA